MDEHEQDPTADRLAGPPSERATADRLDAGGPSDATLENLRQLNLAHAAATQVHLSGWATDPDQAREQKARMYLETARQQIERNHDVDIKLTIPADTSLPTLGEVDLLIRKLERAGKLAQRSAYRRRRRYLEREARSERRPVGYAKDCANELSAWREAERSARANHAPRAHVHQRIARPRARGAGRPAARRRRTTSRDDGPSGSGESEPPAAPRLTLAPKPKAIYTYAVLAAEQRGMGA